MYSLISSEHSLTSAFFRVPWTNHLLSLNLNFLVCNLKEAALQTVVRVGTNSPSLGATTLYSDKQFARAVSAGVTGHLETTRMASPSLS